MKILWLAGWYPSKVQALSGDFIERHAQASALYNHICVIHVVKDTTQKSRNVVIEKRIYSENLIAFIYYYPSFQNYGKAVDVLISNAYYFWLNLKAFYNYKKKFGRPEGVLVHVGIKAGFVAL